MHGILHGKSRVAHAMLMVGEKPHILSALENRAEPNVAALIGHVRGRLDGHADQLRHDAPLVISRAAQWVLENSHDLADAVLAGSPTVPFSRPMLIEAFENAVRRWLDADRLHAFVRDETQSTPAGRPDFPAVVFHNLAGNLFVSGWESITHATLLGAGSIVRCSEADRVFPGIWALAISKFSAMGNELVTSCEWHRDDVSRMRAAAQHSDAVVCFGGDVAVDAIRELTSWDIPFAGHGSTVSFAAITAEELRNNPVEWLAERCGYDFAVYDQQGCLSPRALFVEDGRSRDVDRFVDALHGALAHWEKLLPRRRIPLEDSAALGRARDAVLLDAACGGAGRRASVDSDPFLLTVKPVEQFALGPVNRYADVYLYKSLGEVAEAIGDLRGRLSTLAVVDPKRPPVDLLAALKFRRMCEVGQMQKPPLAWCLDGRRPLQKMLRFWTVQG